MKIKNEIVPFSSLDIPYRYDADENIDLKDDIYVPLLSNSISHKRFTYGFSAKVLTTLITGIEGLILNKGKMKLIIGQTLDDETDNAIQEGLDDLEEGYQAYCLKALDQLINQKRDRNQEYQLGLLSNLIGSGTLEIKFAFKLEAKTRPYQHSKIAIFEGEDSEIVCWEGSANLSNNALFEHFETFSIFKSYTPQDGFPIQGPPIQTQFKKMWRGEKANWDVVPVPDEFYKKWKKAFKESSEKNLREALDAMRERIAKKNNNRSSSEENNGKKEDNSSPNKSLGGTDIDVEINNDFLMDHQRDVIESWKSNNHQGLVIHATGSGKTVTALFAIKDYLKEGKIGLIVVPSKHLSAQWEKEIKKYLPQTQILKVGDDAKVWKSKLEFFSSPNHAFTGPKIILCILNTAAKNNFIKKLSKGDNIIFVADEVHRLGSKNFRNIFNIDSNFRLALSATPKRFRDKEGTKAIYDYFKNELQPKYDLKDAIGTALVNYEYYIHECFLDTEECDAWNEMSEKVSRAWNSAGQEQSDNFVALCSQRSKIAKKAKSKISKAVQILSENFHDSDRWVVYCEEEKQMEELRIKLKEKGFYAMKFYSDLPKESQQLTLKKFSDNGGIILSIKMLDEGIDIPSIDHALIIASDQNPRQHIQRRGRVLRKSENKTKAIIHDLIITPPESTQGKVNNLTKTEILRAIKFNKHALNRYSTEKRLLAVAEKFEIDLNEIEEDFDSIEDEEF